MSQGQCSVQCGCTTSAYVAISARTFAHEGGPGTWGFAFQAGSIEHVSLSPSPNPLAPQIKKFQLLFQFS